MHRLAVVNGPNLNLLGWREPEHYGIKTLDEIQAELVNKHRNDAELCFFQSNHEGSLIDHLQSLRDVSGIIINPGAFTHTSIALRDALLATKLPVIEVHLSNIFAREEFRGHSFISDICCGVLSGFGDYGYHLAVLALLKKLS
jgi:3-dehydroquinate dehydratase-2